MGSVISAIWFRSERNLLSLNNRAMAKTFYHFFPRATDPYLLGLSPQNVSQIVHFKKPPPPLSLSMRVLWFAPSSLSHAVLARAKSYYASLRSKQINLHYCEVPHSLITRLIEVTRPRISLLPCCWMVMKSVHILTVSEDLFT